MGRFLSASLLGTLTSAAAVLLLRSEPLAAAAENAAGNQTSDKDCAGDNGGITLPAGLLRDRLRRPYRSCAPLGGGPEWRLYVNTWSGRYYGNDTPPLGGFLVALQDINGDGQADVTDRFGDTVEQGDHGGTGIALFLRVHEVNDK